MAKQRFNGYEYFLTNETDTIPLPPAFKIEELPASNEVIHNALNMTVLKVFKLQLTPPTLFLFFLIGLFSTTAVLHGAECLQLVHGVWYLLCLPSGYIFLMVYSIVNITDRSWGTREGTAKVNKVNTDQMAWYHQLWFKFTEVFFCCFKEERDKLMGIKDDAGKKEATKEEDEKENNEEKEYEKEVTRESRSIKIKKRQSTRRVKGAAEKQRLLQTDDEEEEEDQFPDQMPSTSDDEIEVTIDEDGNIYEDEFNVGFGGDEHMMQSVWTKTHNELGKFQSQRRPEMMRNVYEQQQFDFDQAYQSGKFKMFVFLSCKGGLRN